MKLESSRRSKRKEAKENHATSFSMFDVFYVVIDEVKYEHIFINHKDGVVHSVLKTTLCFVGRIILLQSLNHKYVCFPLVTLRYVRHFFKEYSKTIGLIKKCY